MPLDFFVAGLTFLIANPVRIILLISGLSAAITQTFITPFHCAQLSRKIPPESHETDYIFTNIDPS